jgi:hypothetical protein
MIPQPLKSVAHAIERLQEGGCSFSITETTLNIQDPNKMLDKLPAMREHIMKNRTATLAVLQHNALTRLIQVIDMAQPRVGDGVKEDFTRAVVDALKLTGDVWEETEVG